MVNKLVKLNLVVIKRINGSSEKARFQAEIETPKMIIQDEVKRISGSELITVKHCQRRILELNTVPTGQTVTLAKIQSQTKEVEPTGSFMDWVKESMSIKTSENTKLKFVGCFMLKDGIETNSTTSFTKSNRSMRQFSLLPGFDVKNIDVMKVLPPDVNDEGQLVVKVQVEQDWGSGLSFHCFHFTLVSEAEEIEQDFSELTIGWIKKSIDKCNKENLDFFLKVLFLYYRECDNVNKDYLNYIIARLKFIRKYKLDFDIAEIYKTFNYLFKLPLNIKTIKYEKTETILEHCLDNRSCQGSGYFGNIYEKQQTKKAKQIDSENDLLNIQ